MGKYMYVLPTQQCNLHCPHCSIYNHKDDFNKEKFLYEMNNFEGNRLVLFGGEVTSNIERMKMVIESNQKDGKTKIGTISTNLIFLNDYLLSIYKSIGSIGTSWNPHRFHTDILYQTWLKNLKTIWENGVQYTLLITLDKDLMNMSVDDFLNKARKDFDHENETIRFEQYVGTDVDQSHYDKADEWLCEIYKKWDLKSHFQTPDYVRDWVYDCDETYTLFPDGTVINRCPHNLPAVTPEACFTCERADICRPCRLTPYCTFPKKLAKLIEEDDKKNLDK